MGAIGQWREKRRLVKTIKEYKRRTLLNAFNQYHPQPGSAKPNNKVMPKVVKSTIGGMIWKQETDRNNWHETGYWQDYQLKPLGYVIVSLLVSMGAIFLWLGSFCSAETVTERLGAMNVLGPMSGQAWSSILGIILLACGVFLGVCGRFQYSRRNKTREKKERRRKKKQTDLDRKVNDQYSMLRVPLEVMFADLPSGRHWFDSHIDKIVETLSFGMEKEKFRPFEPKGGSLVGRRWNAPKTENEEKELKEFSERSREYAEKLSALVSIWCASLRLSPAKIEWQYREDDNVLGTVAFLGDMAGTQFMVENYYEGVPVDDICC